VRYGLSATLFAALALCAATAQAQDTTKKNLITAPSPQEWADLAKLPDWSGIWNPRITDQDAQIRTNMPPWTPAAAAQIAHMMAEERAGRPPPLFVECLPEGMPAWMLVSHNAGVPDVPKSGDFSGRSFMRRSVRHPGQRHDEAPRMTRSKKPGRSTQRTFPHGSNF
jgi:hypothetical protein